MLSGTTFRRKPALAVLVVWWSCFAFLNASLARGQSDMPDKPFDKGGRSATTAFTLSDYNGYRRVIATYTGDGPVQSVLDSWSANPAIVKIKKNPLTRTMIVFCQSFQNQEIAVSLLQGDSSILVAMPDQQVMQYGQPDYAAIKEETLAAAVRPGAGRRKAVASGSVFKKEIGGRKRHLKPGLHSQRSGSFPPVGSG
jgi:hypothetical protein